MSEYSDASLVLIPSGVKEGKLYSQKPLDGTGDFTVVRNSDATYVDKNGIIQTAPPNVARIDHTDGGCGVLLREEQSTNLALWSEDFTQWTMFSSLVNANAITSPDGNITSDKVSANGVNAIHRLASNSISRTSGVSYTVSIYVKYSDCQYIFINAGSFCNAQSTFDIQNGTVSDTVLGTAKIQNLNNGYYKCSVTGTATTTGSIFFFVQLNPTQSLAVDETFLGSESVYLWGAELKEIEGSYIPTQGTTVTRLADVVTVTTPAGVTSITETINGIEQTPIITIPATYQIPNGNINKIIMK